MAISASHLERDIHPKINAINLSSTLNKDFIQKLHHQADRRQSRSGGNMRDLELEYRGPGYAMEDLKSNSPPRAPADIFLAPLIRGKICFLPFGGRAQESPTRREKGEGNYHFPLSGNGVAPRYSSCAAEADVQASATPLTPAPQEQGLPASCDGEVKKTTAAENRTVGKGGQVIRFNREPRHAPQGVPCRWRQSSHAKRHQ